MHRVVVLGAGSISATHVRAFESLDGRAKVVAVAARHTSSAQRVIDECGIDARAYDDYRRAVLEEDCDIVVVCTPPALHCEMTVFCLEHGKHVLVEKPMGMSVEECDRMIAAAKRSGRKLSVVAQSRFFTPIWKTKQLLAEGAAGPLHFVQVNSFWFRGPMYYDLEWRGRWETEGGGCTFVQAVHHIDLLCWMAGSPSEVTAILGNRAHDNSEEEDISLALLRFPSGALGEMNSAIICHGQPQSLYFVCDRASISVPHKIVADVSQPNAFPIEDPELLRALEQRFEEIPAPACEGFAGLADDLIRAIETDTQPVSSGESGRATLELIAAIYESGATGRTVKLPLSPESPFYRAQGIRDNMPRFHQKRTSVEKLEDAPIILASENMR